MLKNQPFKNFFEAFKKDEGKKDTKNDEKKIEEIQDKKLQKQEIKPIIIKTEKQELIDTTQIQAKDKNNQVQIDTEKKEEIKNTQEKPSKEIKEGIEKKEILYCPKCQSTDWNFNTTEQGNVYNFLSEKLEAERKKILEERRWNIHIGDLGGEYSSNRKIVPLKVEARCKNCDYFEKAESRLGYSSNESSYSHWDERDPMGGFSSRCTGTAGDDVYWTPIFVNGMETLKAKIKREAMGWPEEGPLTQKAKEIMKNLEEKIKEPLFQRKYSRALDVCGGAMISMAKAKGLKTKIVMSWGKLVEKLDGNYQMEEYAYPPLILLLGNIYSKKGLHGFVSARNCFKKILKMDETNIPALLSWANVEIKSGDFLEAKEKLDKVIQIDSENPDALCFLGDIKAKELNYEKADDFLNKVLKLNPKNTFALSIKGENFLNRGHLDKAESFFQKILQIASKNIRTMHNLRIIATEKENYQDAESLFEKTLKMDPNNSQTYIDYMNMEIKMGNLEKANMLFQEMKRKNMKNNPYVCNIGADMLSRKEGYGEEAKEYFQKALEITGRCNKNSIPIYNTRAKMWAREEDYEQARKDIKNSLDSFPVWTTQEGFYWVPSKEQPKKNILYIITLNTGAEIERKAGELVKAEEYLKEALSLDQENAYTHFSYAKMLIVADRKKEANEHLKKAKDLGLTTPEVFKMPEE